MGDFVKVKDNTLIIENPYDDFYDIPEGEYDFIKYLYIQYTNNVHIPNMHNLEVIRINDSFVKIPDGLPKLHVVICEMIEKVQINLENYQNLIILKEERTRIIHPNNNKIDIERVLRNNNIRIITIDDETEFMSIDEICKLYHIN